MSYKTWGILACLALSLSTGGCKKLFDLAAAQDRAAAEDSGSSEAAESPEVTKDAQLSAKLEPYIDCLNRATGDAFSSKRAYLRYIDPEKGPTGKENGVWVNTLEVNTCLQGLDKAKSLPPALPELDATLGPYRDALSALVPLVKTAHDYYDRKDYKDDNWAKGKAMHRPLMAAFNQFEQANTAFEAQLVAVNDALHMRRLARLAADPKRHLQYLIERPVSDAKKLVKLSEVHELSELDGAAYDQALETYESHWNELDQYVGAHSTEAGKVIALSIYMSAGNDFLKSTKELARRKRENKDFNRDVHTTGEHVDGHPAQVLATYNQLIDRSNSLTFRD